MTPQAQRIAIVEAVGWKFKDELWWSPAVPNAVYQSFPQLESGLPNYLESLDAIMPAVREMPDGEFELCLLELWKITTNNESPIEQASYPTRLRRAYSLAAAAQWCEAYLRAIGKWDDLK